MAAILVLILANLLTQLACEEQHEFGANTPDIISDYIQKEVGQGNFLGPSSESAAPAIHINRFGVIPRNTSQANGA